MILLSLLITIAGLILVPIVTFVIGMLCMLAALLRMEDRPGSPYDVLPRAWARALVAIAGVRVRVHNPERGGAGTPHIFLANHVSWYDIPALGSFLPRAKFVAKAELFKIPVLGGAMRAVGMVPIERQNRKAAFGAYDEASRRIREGDSVIVFPEGSRGYDYPLRPFKKGPFVLAIDAGVPIVPVLLHGTREVIRKGSMLLHPGRVDVHLLEPVSVEGYGYDDRDALADKVRSRIAEALLSHYGIQSPPQRSAPVSTNTQTT
ncbi:MAG TPA: lysophospholipid acyltransferase family protein [Gemmatimonadaceae bacterium]|jgi:1-acyl-sn-glycerol-3-phosphate acyltransferase|nr:lysophospholipid acyltransferase family protein [Gemmatimonadaceae bacterium]